MGATETAIKIKERPILFSGPMARAILEGRKSVTRRVIKPQPPADAVVAKSTVEAGAWHWCLPEDNPTGPSLFDTKIVCPYGKSGDRLWVRETHGIFSVDLGTVSVGFKERLPEGKTIAQTDGGLDVISVTFEQHQWAETQVNNERWRPSIFMPRWASRLTLEVVSVGVERLQEISTVGIQAEGIKLPPSELYPHTNADDKLREQWMCGWDKLNSKRGYSWASNPWIWRIEFKKVDISTVVPARDAES